MSFIGRETELEDLRREFTAPRPSLVIVYGRRRVGKSTLLQEAAKAAAASVYFQATIGEPTEGLAEFKAEIANALGGDPVLAGLSTWEGVLRWLADTARARRGLTVIIDEFPYLADKDDSLPSVIQKVWDSGAMKDGQLKLALCGSLISYMEKLLTERNPLFGRRTMTLDVEGMPLRDAAQFLPGYSPADVISSYGVFGGVPYYLQLIDTRKSLAHNIVRLVLSKSGQLFDEPEFLLKSEVREPRRYAATIGAIATGANKSSEIVNRVGLKDVSQLTAYIEHLVRLRIVERQRSFDATDRERDARYAIVDPLMRFWHRFARPNISAISRGFGGRLFERIEINEFPDYMGLAFEEICREHLRRYADERMDVPAREIGRIWSKDFDLDIAGKLLDGSWVFGECKWTYGQVGTTILDGLAKNGASVTGGEKVSRHFALFSKSGFTEDIRRMAETDAGIVLYGLDDIVYPPPAPACDHSP